MATSYEGASAKLRRRRHPTDDITLHTLAQNSGNAGGGTNLPDQPRKSALIHHSRTNFNADLTVLGALGICPVVKRIWTPTWFLLNGGWCFLLLAGFYLMIEVWQRKRWAFLLVVIGMNSVAAYCMAHLLGSFLLRNLRIHLGPNVFQLAGEAYEPFFLGAAVLLINWQYRRKNFLRV